MKLRSAAAGILAATLMVMPYAGHTDTADAEAEYALQLSIDTIEVPRNWIENGVEIKVPIRITNNPGFDHLTFLVRKTEKAIISGTIDPIYTTFSRLSNSYFDEGVVIATGIGSYYDSDGIFGYIELELFHDIEVGDFIPLDFITEDPFDDEKIGFYKGGIYYGQENLTNYENGGILIVDDKPMYGLPCEETTEPPTTQPPAKTTAAKTTAKVQHSSNTNTVQNNDSGSDENADDTSENDNSTEVTETTGTSAKTTSTKTTAKTTAKTTVSTLTSSETASKTDTETTSENTTETTETQTTANNDKKGKMSENQKKLIPIIAVAALAAVGIGTFVILQKKSGK